MFPIDSADATADNDALGDNSFLYSPHHHDLLPFSLSDGNAHPRLDLKSAGSNAIPFAGFESLVYERYNDSEPSSVHYGDMIDTSERAGSHMSSREDGEAAVSNSNGITNGFNSSHAPSPLLASHGSRQIHHQMPESGNTQPRQTKTNGSYNTSNLAEWMPLSTSISQSPNSQSMLKDSVSPHHSLKSSGMAGRDMKFSSTPELSQSQESSGAQRMQNASPVKNKTSEFRARSSIPASLSWEEFARQSILAAYSSRLTPFAMHPGEYKLLREHVTHPQVTIYLNIRNAILRLWTKNPLVHVTLEEAVGCSRESRYFNLAKVAYYWLLRNGYINFGCVEVPNTAGIIARVKAKAGPRQTVVIIGAGMSGLGCARQLEGLFAQLADQWTRTGERPPKVIVLESRPRVGGRVYSHPLLSQSKGTLPSGYRCTAEMGAQIVTGFEHGNPMNALIRGQLGIPYHALRDNTILYDHDGTVVERDQDILVEKLYNDILERASIFRNKPPSLRTVEGDRTLMLFGREPSGDGGALISELEESDVPLPANGRTVTTTIEEKPSSVSEKLPGRAYQLTTGFNPGLSAAKAASSMGWRLKSGVSADRSIELDTIARSSEHPTLGQTMDEGIRQYQSLVDLAPKDLRLLNWHHANLEYANAVSVNQLSLSGWDQDLGNEFEGEHTTIIGGYQQVPRGLWQSPNKLDVRFHAVVKSIHYDVEERSNAKAVKVECQNGEVFEADKVVITTPLGVLKDKSINFQPRLPDWKQNVIDRLGFGLLNKVVLVYDKPFWETERDMFGLLNEAEQRASLEQSDYSAQRGRFYLFWNCIKTSGRPMLVALMAGDAAHFAEASTDDDLIRDVTSRLAKMFAPTLVPLPSESIITRWKRDPFARGSYSYVGPLTQTGDYDVMAQRHGPLHFAGEATCGTHPATVHGAYLSGLRAAGEVVESLVGPIKVSEPLVEKKIKMESLPIPLTHTAKHSLEDDAAQTEDRNVRQHRNEDYEASVIGAILNEIGERPIKPGRGVVNPFLLYTKDHWHICKAECDKARKIATGDVNAKASKQEIRTALGQKWRTASAEVKKPYLDQTQNARDISAATSVEFKEKVAAWDRDAARIRQEYIQNHPPPDISGNGFMGKTAIEYGGGRRARRL